ncbi:hypothetical protein [Alkalicoccobacillus plakortidis]|uniref:Uncharacterized protein n=1 Tax=Alkalicoccobacillus plakortidis TaxID=444060 RepID=A0ABT0XP17_9BACI|nr:hypothetical protein [Alkalicoccobacillus plakortidis]MCM2677636.1 hypothetical protein [Alkalicoccobacillus plakortidis]
MENHTFNATPEKLKGKVVSDVEITDHAVVIKFEDDTFLDIYLDPTKQALKTSTNKL